MEMVWLLLNFIHDDGDANWLLHLETFRAMLSYDRAFDHLNYLRWGTVYLTDMALTAHMMAAATASFKVISETSAGSNLHRELGSQKIERDENDVNNIIQCIETKLVNPFDIGKYQGEKMPLINIATGTVAPSEVSESLLSAKEEGEKAMIEFVQARLISDKANFWDPLKKTTSKPFKA